jgi:CRP/FNR family transcriptional regulator, anaerobic regulatory protein
MEEKILHVEDELLPMKEILDSLGKIHPLSEECKEYLLTVAKRVEVPKKRLLLRPGQVDDRLFFIYKGLLRCYYKMGDRQVTDWFFTEGEAAVSVDSWYDQKPGQDYIETVEDSVVYTITFQEMEHAYETYPEMNVIGRVLTTKYLRVWHRLARNTRFLTAEERYRILIAEQPGWLQRVPLYVLSTYLDMIPSTISRLRAK